MDSVAALIVAFTGFAAFVIGTVRAVRKDRTARVDKQRDLELENVRLEARVERLEAELEDSRRWRGDERGRRH